VYELIAALLHQQAGATALLLGSARSVWSIWGGIAGRVLAAGAVWVAISHYDQGRPGPRLPRLLYLYLVLIVAAPLALGSGVWLLDELLRRALGFRPDDGTWTFLRDGLPPLVPAAMAWAYHWGVLRQQRLSAAVPAVQAPATAVPTNGIPWPRRPAIAVPALIALLWLGLDFATGTDAKVLSSDWWRDRLAFSVAAGVVGAVLWLGAWSILERAAASDPERERTATARRSYLGIIILVSALTAIGFLIALLWLAIRTVLGEQAGATTLSWALKDLSTVIIAVALAWFHARIIRADGRYTALAPAAAPPVRRLTVLVAPGAVAALGMLQARAGARLTIAGHLEEGAAPVSSLDLPALVAQIDVLGTNGHSDQALVLLYPEGGAVYPYRT